MLLLHDTNPSFMIGMLLIIVFRRRLWPILRRETTQHSLFEAEDARLIGALTRPNGDVCPVHTRGV